MQRSTRYLEDSVDKLDLHCKKTQICSIKMSEKEYYNKKKPTTLSGAQYRKRKAKKLQIEQELTGSLNKFLTVETSHLEKKQKIAFTHVESGASAAITSEKTEQTEETEQTNETQEPEAGSSSITSKGVEANIIARALQDEVEENLDFPSNTTELSNSALNFDANDPETIAKFDNVMVEHLRRIQTSERKNIAHYLGDGIQNEIIHLISEGIKKQILDMFQSAKYYSIILDTTPDITHTKQLTLVIRY
ncbi:unnamed protein product, partial [Didymodactylos carnosus]